MVVPSARQSSLPPTLRRRSQGSWNCFAIVIVVLSMIGIYVYSTSTVRITYQRTSTFISSDDGGSTLSSTSSSEQMKSLTDARPKPSGKRAWKHLPPISDKFQSRGEEEIAMAKKIFSHRHQKRSQESSSLKANTTMFHLLERNEFNRLQLRKEAYRFPPNTPQYVTPKAENDFVKSKLRHKVGHTGITIDLARFSYPLERLKHCIRLLASLGFNTLHLRLVDDLAFAIQTQSHPNIVLRPPPDDDDDDNTNHLNHDTFRELVQYGHSHGVDIFPEINIISHAGGWFASGLVAPCPQTACSSSSRTLALDFNQTSIYALLSNIIEELYLSTNSPFLHLGYNKYAEAQTCLNEAAAAASGNNNNNNNNVDINNDYFDMVEHKLQAVLQVLGISQEFVIRWESPEYIDSSSSSNNDIAPEQRRRRAGYLTHYYQTNPPPHTKPFFISTKVRFDGSNNNINDDAYDIYLQAQSYTQYEMILGVLATTIDMSPLMWSGHNVDGKLVALALGLSDMGHEHVLGRKPFSQLYTRLVQHLELEGDVNDLFGKSRWSSTRWQQELNSEQNIRDATICERMTVDDPR